MLPIQRGQSSKVEACNAAWASRREAGSGKLVAGSWEREAGSGKLVGGRKR